MSKKKLEKHLSELTKEQLEEQILEFYEKFKPVKTYYSFLFNPREDKLVEEAKVKISKEYFPPNKRRAKLRRTTATKLIKHFKDLGLSVDHIADVMLYAIEVALVYTERRQIKNDNFFIGMYRQFEEVSQWINRNRLPTQFTERLNAIAENTWEQDWFNKNSFQDLV